MREIRKWYVQLASGITALMTIVVKWLIGVLVRKLITSSWDIESTTASSGEERAFYEFVFLDKLSFQEVTGLAVAATVVLSANSAAAAAMALLRAAQTARRLRHEIIDATTSSSGAQLNKYYTETAGKDPTGSDLNTKVRLIEDFQAYDEHRLLVNTTVLALSIVLSFIFVWYGGVLAIGIFGLSEAAAKVFEVLRARLHRLIEDNAIQVNARLLDIIKNKTKIKIMGTTASEKLELQAIEESSDEDRLLDAKFKFFRDLSKLTLIGLLPVLMAIVSWPLVERLGTSAALDTEFSIMISILLLDEGHKALIYLAVVVDRQKGAREAQIFIDDILGHQRSKNNHNEESVLLLEGETSHTSESSASDTDIEKPSPKMSPSWRRLVVPGSRGVSLNDIVLRYPGRSRAVLKEFSQSFECGKVHGLIGESGSGKSTLLKVVADLICPERGTMSVWEGIKVAYVSQDEKLFARTIRENVTYGSATPRSDEDIWAALQMANIVDWVSSLPKGLDELLVDGEQMVSGGQLQRLHLAHLFCTCWDSDLVMLDECLSALDKTSRDLLIDRLGAFLEGKTSIIVTHHSEMLRICDLVHGMSDAESHSPP